MDWLPRLIGIVPLGIGITVMAFLWLSPFGAFHSPPLFFRIFGSFIALGFILFGVGAFKAAGMMNRLNLRKTAEQLQNLQQQTDNSSETQETPAATDAPGTGYECPSCGAALGGDADVSPSGDAKCRYCKRWFNIHQS